MWFQVVLEDGRIIEEGEPEVTVDTVEDVESHSDDGEEDRHVVGGWSRSFHTDRALQCSQPGTCATANHLLGPAYTVDGQMVSDVH